MKRTAMCVLLLLIGVVLQAQQPATYGSILGRIVPEFTGIPLTLFRYTYGDEGEIKLINVAQVRTSTEIGKFGEYRFDKAAPGEGALASFEVRDVDLEVEVVVSRARLTGRIVIEEPDGTFRAAGGLQLELRPKVLGPAERGETFADGSLQRDRVGPNDYNVEFLNLPAKGYVARLLDGDRDVLKEGLEVRSTNVHIEGLVSLAGGSVEGTVVTPKNEKAARAVVALVPDSRLEARHLYRTATTDENGSFVIRGVAPGTYQIFAWSKLNGAAYKNADFMRPYVVRGIPLTFERNGRVVVEAQLLDE